MCMESQPTEDWKMGGTQPQQPECKVKVGEEAQGTPHQEHSAALPPPPSSLLLAASGSPASCGTSYTRNKRHSRVQPGSTTWNAMLDSCLH